MLKTRSIFPVTDCLFSSFDIRKWPWPHRTPRVQKQWRGWNSLLVHKHNISNSASRPQCMTLLILITHGTYSMEMIVNTMGENPKRKHQKSLEGLHQWRYQQCQRKKPRKPSRSKQTRSKQQTKIQTNHESHQDPNKRIPAGENYIQILCMTSQDLGHSQ